jgi:hypothetical protein
MALGVVLAAMSVLGAAGVASADEPDARRFYVSPTGSDAAQGNVDHPFRTLQRARDAVREAGRWARETDGTLRRDLIVEIAGGTYELGEPLTFDARDSGSEQHPVVWKAASSDPVVVSGGKRITGWTVYDADKGIWAADVAAGLDTRQLYVNGKRAVRARSQGGLPGAQQTAYGYTTSDASIASWPDAGDLEFVYRSTWIEPRCGVDHVTGNAVHMKEPCFTNSTKPGRPGVLAGLPVWMENAYELLDQPGEWYLDRGAGRVYYKPRATEDLSTAKVVAPVLESLVEGRGTLDAPVHDIQFNGLSFSYATWLRPNDPSGFSEVQANFTVVGPNPSPSGDTEDFGSFPQTPANVTFEAAHDIRFERNSFEHLGAVGLQLGAGSRGNAVIGNVFTDISGSGLQVGDTDATPSDTRAILADNEVSNNSIHDVAAEYHGGVGMWIGYTKRSTIAHNVLTDLPYTGITIGWGWGYVDNVAGDNKIVDNLIHHHLQLLSDGAAIYSNGIQRGQRITGNVMHDQKGLWGVLGLDNGSRYNTVVNNVGWNNPYGISLNDNYGDVVVRHNFTDKPNLNSPGPQTGTDGAAPSVIADNPIVTDVNVMPASIVGKAGLEPAYADLSPTTPPSDTTAPTAPANARVTGRTSSSVVLAWDAATDDTRVTGYEVDQEGVAISVSSPGPNATAIVSGLEPEHTYTFAVHARDAAANLSRGATITVTTRPAPTVPSDLPAAGLKLWLSGDELDGVAGSQVALWGDQSGTGHDVVQTAAGAQPTLVSSALDGAPALRFDGSTDWLGTSSPISSSRAYTVFAVSTLGNAASGPFYNGNSAADGYGFYRFTPGRYGIVHGGLRGEAFGPVTDTGFQLTTMERGADAMVQFYVNGAQSGAAVPGTPNPASGATYVGAVNPFTGGFFGGDVAEIVVYDRGLSEAERAQVTDYLKAKHGL